jgi:hypothetical protein
MDLKDINEYKKHVEDITSRFSPEETKSYIKYDNLRKSFFNWCFVALFAGAAVSAGGVIKRYSLDHKDKTIGVDMYEQVDAKLDSVRTNFYEISDTISDSANKVVLEEIAKLESEKEHLYNSKAYMEYEAKTMRADKITFYGITSGILLASILAGISSFYNGKKKKLWYSKEAEVENLVK